MNKLVNNYIFDASAKTITSFEFTSIERILSIVNLTDGVIIYSPITPAKGGALANSVLTLDYDTTSMDDSDILQIVVENQTTNVKWSFSKNVAANGVDTDFASIVKAGSGMAISQSSGNLVVTTGTTAYSESIIRSNKPFSGAGLVRWGLTLSQRIANNNFAVEFVDVTGDGLTMTINSATSVTVTIPNNTFTTANDAGKGIWIGNISVASCLPQRATIASVSGNDVTLTVAGFPASGSGTCSLFGYNHHQVIYSGTTATALGTGYATQRKGWQYNAGSTTINTTASGHVGIMTTGGNQDIGFLDQVLVTGAALQSTSRLTSNQNVPDNDTPLYLQLRFFNGSTAPASTTTATFHFVNAEIYDTVRVNIASVQPHSQKNAVPVQGAVTVSGTVTASGTVGTAAIDAAISGNPVLQAGRASSARPTAMSADNDAQAPWLDRHGANIVELAAPRGLKDQQKTTITSSTSETTIVTAVASVFMDLHGLVITNTSATACNVTIKDATAGTTRFIFAVPAASTVGFMLPSSDAHKQAVVNNNWTATCSASVASIEITALTVRRV
jgi:hypothetical protein